MTRQIAKEIFKAYDIRGVVGATLNIEDMESIGMAIAHALKNFETNEVCVGRDGRHSGLELSRALIKGLVKSSINVIDIGCVTTPMLYFGALNLTKGNGVMVTGSHNPPEYNGLKITIAGSSLAGDEIQNLYNFITCKSITNAFEQQQGVSIEKNITEYYFQTIENKITLERKIKVAIDCGNGIAGEFAPTVFRRLGCDVDELFCKVDGGFPNHHPDPSQPENLLDLVTWLKKNDAELGLAFDGDGDRLGVVTKSGEVIYPDRQLMLMAAEVLSRNPGAEIIYDVKCSAQLTKWIKEHGGKPVMHQTGHSLIKKKMKEIGSPLAGEMSGHIFFKDRWFGFDDGIYAGARLLEILSKCADINSTLTGLANALNTPELKIPLKEGQNHSFIERFRKTKKLKNAKKIISIDGIRAEYNSGFGLIRASNTTPVLVLRFEAASKEELDIIKREFRDAIDEIDNSLKLPF